MHHGSNVSGLHQRDRILKTSEPFRPCCGFSKQNTLKPVLKGMAVEPSAEPITTPITKFGGQHVWIAEPVWPFSQRFNRPIAFLGQIEPKPEIFGEMEAKLASIFLDLYDADLDTNDDKPGAWCCNPECMTGLHSLKPQAPQWLSRMAGWTENGLPPLPGITMSRWLQVRKKTSQKTWTGMTALFQQVDWNPGICSFNWTQQTHQKSYLPRWILERVSEDGSSCPKMERPSNSPGPPIDDCHK